jgi:hypothetical protein
MPFKIKLIFFAAGRPIAGAERGQGFISDTGHRVLNRLLKHAFIQND